MGRKGELVWNASEAHYVKNHSLALYAIQDAIKHGDIHHQSKPGVPDILLFWLGTMRYGATHSRTQDMISRALHGWEPGVGVPGDGGWLDQTVALVEAEINEGVNDSRKRVVYSCATSKWLRGCILKCISPGDADWRRVSNTTLPSNWPIATIERVFKLALDTNTNPHSVLLGQIEGQALVEQLCNHPTSQTMMDLLLQDVCNSGVKQYAPPTLQAVEHYHAKGVGIGEDILDKIAVHFKPNQREHTPALLATWERHQMDKSTVDMTRDNHTRPSNRL